MARPKKNNADYFPHDSGMRNDPRVKAVRRKFGLDGYAVWSMLLESLTDADFFELKSDKISIEIMSGDFEVDSEKLSEIIEYLLFIELLQSDAEKQIIFSNRHKNNFSALLSKRKRERCGVFASENPQTASENPQTASENPQRKGKENKEKDIKSNTPQTPQGEKKSPRKNLKKDLSDYLVNKIEGTSFVEYQDQLLEFFEYRMSLPASGRYKTFRGIDGLLKSVGDLVRAGLDPVECLQKTMEEEWLKPKPEYFLEKGTGHQGKQTRTESNVNACIDFITGD